MKIEISSFGIGSRYTVDFDRTDTTSLETFLASKGVFPSDRQLKLFASSGECVEFTRIRGRNAVKSVVKDATEAVRRDAWRLKARGIVNRWNPDKNLNRMIKILIKFDVGSDCVRVSKAVRLKEKWDAKIEKLVAELDAM